MSIPGSEWPLHQVATVKLHHKCYKTNTFLVPLFAQGFSTFSATLLAFTFIFGNAVKNMFESMLFLFVEHAYDGMWPFYASYSFP